MCGIFGKVGQLEASEMEVATQMLCHRGPDGQLYESYDQVHLFHARLSIVDIAGGTQPMADEDLAIIFNGEIYNHQEIRDKFDLKCHTRSDTETIMRMYSRFGLDMLQYMDGMFAIALYDKGKKTLYLLRDRAGKKPLYYSKQGNSIYFASEQNLLQKIVKPTIKLSAIAEYLQTGMVYGEATPYEDIYELKPGHLVSIQVDSQELSDQKQWWSIEPYYQQTLQLSEQDALVELDARLKQAVKSRVESSDLEVGCFLSGGIDSGIITAMAAKVKPDLRTFTVKFGGQYDESAIAGAVSKHIGTDHHELSVSYDQLANDFEKIVTAYGEPFMDDSQIPSYYVAREAKKHLTVIINGDGGDELFGGYRRYVPFGNKLLHNAVVKNISGAVLPFLPTPTDKMSLYNYAYRLARLNSMQLYEQYLSSGTDMLYDQAKSFKVQPSGELRSRIEQNATKEMSALRQIMLTDFETILPNILLKKIDISSMQHSLEGRSPFLSKGILEFAPSLPDSLKIKGTTTKYLLRKLAAKYLPAGVEKLPKRGFEVPVIPLMENTLKPMLKDYLSSANALYRSVVDPKVIDALLQDKEGASMTRDRRARILFSVLAMEVWHQKLGKH
ncbi:asparagine synthase (glutamine-hydrolyzing) [uncultured Pontibacter sp.]|uniref:asparagine synthase (glutamine-hydrolyzing) n=1 Tax=uncultured Pontibacter sp. TaxID=453356 RepID=UPI002617144A|nr:asparagine synthase (glutamine-hydrolyzing) [uncultured Pontibacter sp.]